MSDQKSPAAAAEGGEGEHVLIIGAGVTGLLIAHGLKQAGVPFTIFDAEPNATARKREWTMIMHWSLPLIRKLLPEELASQLKARASIDPSLDFDESPCNTIRFYNGADGSIIRDVPISDSSMRVSRQRLRALCAEGIDVRYGHKLAGVHVSSAAAAAAAEAAAADGSSSPPAVTVTFENGASASGSMVIGADGARSPVREYLFGGGGGSEEVVDDEEEEEEGKEQTSRRRRRAGLTPLNMPFMNIVTGYASEAEARLVRSAHPVTSFMLRPGMGVFLAPYEIPDPERPAGWRFHVAVMWQRERRSGGGDGGGDSEGEWVDYGALSHEEKRAAIMRVGEQLAEPFRTAVCGIPDGVEIPSAPLGTWVAEPWDTRGGRVTLAGDAAHPMTPHRGQGCNNAIQDAWNLVESIKKIHAGSVVRRPLAAEGGSGGGVAAGSVSGGASGGASGGSVAAAPAPAPANAPATAREQLIQACSDESAERGAAETKLSLENAHALLDWDRLMQSPMFKHSLNKQHAAVSAA